MMKVNMKHVVEIAGGLLIGGLASDVVNGVVNLTKKKVKDIKLKKKKETLFRPLSFLFAS